MAGGEQHARFALEDGLGAVAVMHVEVGDRDPLQAMHGQRMSSGHRDVVEQAEAHRPLARGVMAGWTHRAERAPCATAEHRIDRGHDGTGRTQGRLGRAGAHHGVLVQGEHGVWRRTDHDLRDVGGVVHAQQLFAGGLRRLDAIERGETVVVQRLQHRVQPRRPFDMPRAGVVLQAGRVGVQPQHAVAYSAGLGLRRRSCCHSTSPWPLARASTREITNSRSDSRLR